MILAYNNTLLYIDYKGNIRLDGNITEAALAIIQYSNPIDKEIVILNLCLEVDFCEGKLYYSKKNITKEQQQLFDKLNDEFSRICQLKIFW